MNLSLKTWALIHKIEDKYGTLAIPNNTPMMIELHKSLGVKTVKKRRLQHSVKFKKIPQEDELEMVRLIKTGYTLREVTARSKFSKSVVIRIADEHNLKFKRFFKYRFNGVYLLPLNNLNYWGIAAKNVENMRNIAEKLNYDFIVQKYRWGDISDGDQYMIFGNDREVFTK